MIPRGAFQRLPFCDPMINPLAFFPSPLPFSSSMADLSTHSSAVLWLKAVCLSHHHHVLTLALSQCAQEGLHYTTNLLFLHLELRHDVSQEALPAN